VRDLPTGVVTLLFTDVEGSTRLLHDLGDGYGEALHEHRRRLRAAFADHEGVEVDTQGDEERAPLRRNIDADEVAAAAAYLLGPDSGGVTATTLYVDSGYHSMGM